MEISPSNAIVVVGRKRRRERSESLERKEEALVVPGRRPPLSERDQLAIASLPEEQRKRLHAWEQASIAPATRRAVESTARTFSKWLKKEKYFEFAVQLSETPWPICVAYLDHLAVNKSAKQSTITRAWSVLCKWVVPRLRGEKQHWEQAVKGARRALASRGKQPKAPFTLAHLRRAVELLGDCEDTNALCLRKLYLCLSFWTAERRAELRAARWSHVTFMDQGIILAVPTSKGDQMGVGQQVSIVHRDDDEDKDVCACCSLQRWKERCEEADGGRLAPDSFVLRRVDSEDDEITERSLSYHAMSGFVKEAAESVGVAPESMGCHSTRRGVLQHHANNLTPAHQLMELSRHAGLASLQPYLKQSSAAFSNKF